MTRSAFLTWVMALTCIIHVSCKKDTGSVGLDSGDAALQPFSIDTFTLITRTVREDSLRSDRTSYQLLGALNNSNFGASTAGMALSFSLPNASFAFPAGVRIDSVVLQAEYTGKDQFVGNLATPINIKIEEIDGRMYADSAYYSNRQVNAINAQSFNGHIHNLNDSVIVIENGIRRAFPPQLRLKLGQTAIDKMQNAQASNLGSNTAFQDYFNGLKITADGSGIGLGQGNIVYLNFNSPRSGLAVYFNDTGKYIFPVGQNGVRVNLFSHNFSGIPAIQAQLNDTLGNYDVTYIQSMAGLKTRIDVPGLLNLLDSGVYAVIDASLRFYYDDATTSTEFPAFSRMLLLKRDGANRNNFLADQLLNSDFYGGIKNSSGFYEFRITREIQDILNNYRLNGLNLNTGFFLIAPSDNPITASHLIMDMQKQQSKGVRLKLTLVKAK